MYISGPSLYIKLVNKDKHELILFGEHHSDLKDQHECHVSSENLRIDQFLKKEFSKNKKCGFYLEITHNMIQKYNSNEYKTNTKSYMHLLRSLFADNAQFDKKTNKIVKSKIFPNVMFHYTDIRLDITDYHHFIYYNNFYITEIKYELLLLKEKFISFINSFKKSKCFNKIKNKYTNDKLKIIINNQLNEIHNCIDKFIILMNKKIQKCTKLETYYHEHKLNMSSYKLEKLYTRMMRIYAKINNKITIITLLINDLYLLKRILDKKYDTQVDYIYNGCWHTINLVFFLLNYTDYKLISCSGNKDYILNNYTKYNPNWLINHFDSITNNILGYTEYDGMEQCIKI